MHDFFANAGTVIGQILRSLIEWAHQLFGSLGGAFNGFFGGLGESLGVNHSIFRIIILIIGALITYKGIKNLIGRRFITGVIALFIGISTLSWVVG